MKREFDASGEATPIGFDSGDAPRRAGPLSFIPMLGRGGDTIKRLKADAERSPEDAATFEKLGIAFAKAKDYGQAANAFVEAVTIDPSRVQAWSALGEACVHLAGTSEMPVPPEARDAFNRALALNPNDVRAQFYLAIEKDVQGARQEAIDDWLGLLRSVPLGSGPDKAIRSAILSSLQREMATGG